MTIWFNQATATVWEQPLTGQRASGGRAQCKPSKRQTQFVFATSISPQNLVGFLSQNLFTFLTVVTGEECPKTNHLLREGVICAMCNENVQCAMKMCNVHCAMSTRCAAVHVSCMAQITNSWQHFNTITGFSCISIRPLGSTGCPCVYSIAQGTYRLYMSLGPYRIFMHLYVPRAI